MVSIVDYKAVQKENSSTYVTAKTVKVSIAFDESTRLGLIEKYKDS